MTAPMIVYRIVLMYGVVQIMIKVVAVVCMMSFQLMAVMKLAVQL